ncbi:MAG: hypothetical protein QXX17_07745, partial [Conexivisphaerales archaeon]
WGLFGNAAAKLKAWQRCGATIVYLTSKKTSENIEKVRTALKDGGAPIGQLFFRIGDEDYGQVAKRIARRHSGRRLQKHGRGNRDDLAQAAD